MDDKTIRILKTIAAEGTGSPESIHRKTGIPATTVHYHLERLRSEGIIRNDLFDIDMEKLGFSLTVITEIRAEFDEGYHTEVGEKLAEIEGVNQVYFTMGVDDFVVISRLTTHRMIQRLIADFEAIDEVDKASSKFVLTTLKDEPYPLNDYERETLVDAIAHPLTGG